MKLDRMERESEEEREREMDSQRNGVRDKGADRMRANKSYTKKASPDCLVQRVKMPLGQTVGKLLRASNTELTNNIRYPKGLDAAQSGEGRGSVILNP